jgi:hypothetical protein
MGQGMQPATAKAAGHMARGAQATMQSKWASALQGINQVASTLHNLEDLRLKRAQTSFTNSKQDAMDPLAQVMSLAGDVIRAMSRGKGGDELLEELLEKLDELFNPPNWKPDSKEIQLEVFKKAKNKYPYLKGVKDSQRKPFNFE